MRGQQLKVMSVRVRVCRVATHINMLEVKILNCLNAFEMTNAGA